MTLGEQITYLFILGLPIASIAWTVTHEEVFREPRDWCKDRSQSCRRLFERKFFYLFTCEYCFSHYIVVVFLVITRFRLLFDGWRGYLVAFFALVWVSNFYINVFARVRLEIKKERVEIAAHEKNIADSTPQPQIEVPQGR